MAHEASRLHLLVEPLEEAAPRGEVGVDHLQGDLRALGDRRGILHGHRTVDRADRPLAQFFA